MIQNTQHLPFDIIEKIGNYCDIDTRRYLNLKPQKIDIKKYENLLKKEHIIRKPFDTIILNNKYISYRVFLIENNYINHYYDVFESIINLNFTFIKKLTLIHVNIF